MAINQTTATGHSMHDAVTINDDAALQSPAAQAHHSPARVTKKEVDVHGTLHAGGPQRASEAMINTVEEHKAAARREAQEEELAPPPPPRANPEATTTGYAASADPLAELQSDPHYQDLQAYAQAMEQMLKGNFDYVDHNFAGFLGIGADDGKISMEDIRKAALDGVDGAVMFQRHPELFQLISGGSDTISREQVGQFLTQVKGELHAMEQDAKRGAAPAAGAGTGASASGGSLGAAPHTGTPPPPVSPPPAAGTTKTETQASTANNTSGASGTSKPKHTAAELDAMTNPPEAFKPTSKTAEGKTSETYEYLDKWSESLESKLDDAIANGDEALSQKLQRKLSKIELCKQMIMNLQKQQMEAASTMAKLYSDMAMTAIHNLR